MSKTGRVFSMGSGGATYEHHVQAAYLLAMILRIEVPLVTKGKICDVAFQTTNRGYATDGLMVIVDFGKRPCNIELGAYTFFHFHLKIIT